MNNKSNQSQLHEEVLNDIREQLDRISEIEQREQDVKPKSKLGLKNIIAKIFHK